MSKARSSRSFVLLSVVKIAVVAYLGSSLLLLVRQASYVYYPEKPVGLTPAYFKLDYEDVRFQTTDGETIAAWYVPASDDADTVAGRRLTVLFSHGNAGNIGGRLDSLRTFHQLGFNVLLFDYRGYGDSTGKPTEQGTYEDVRAAWDYLVKERGMAAGDILLFGRSLGGAVVSWLAEQVTPGALILESTFTSAPDMGKKMFPVLPVALFCRFKYNTLACLARVDCPVVIAHGVDDKTVPFLHGQRLFEAAKEPKLFVEMTGGHNGGGLDVDPVYQKALMAFLEEHIGQGNEASD